MKKPWLYIPIETKVRELHGKTLLASFAAISGFNVMVGSKKDINSKSAFFPKGVIFNVGLTKGLAKNSQKFKREGHKVAAIDEEGIVTLNDDLYLWHRVSEKALAVTDIFFCWGNRQASLIEKKAKKTNCRIFIAGNPRFDMLRPEYKIIFNKDTEEIRNKYGKFILINTNFGHGNHFAGESFLLESLKEKGWMDDPRDKNFFRLNIEWQKRMFKKFQEMIPELSKNFKDHNIIIRPHPSENHEVWEKIAKNHPNVLVVHSGNVIPWLMATDILIHNGCTTAVEAFVLGTKALAYRPFIIEEQETEMPNKISIQAFNLNELINLAEKIINEKAFDDDYESKKKYLEYFLAGIDGKTASENICEKLSFLGRADSSNINIFLLLIFEILDRALFIFRKIAFKNKKNYISAVYQLHKNPGLILEDFQNVINSLSKINEKFKDLRVKKIGMNFYKIYENK
jgi:surface carbohydrate biosynthesis protein